MLRKPSEIIINGESLEKILNGYKNSLILTDVNLRGADLSNVDLTDVNLRNADLRSSDLRSANLRGANLRGANLRGANLRGADLRGANLSNVDLTDVYLRKADLTNANLRGADLRGANLSNANLRGADLSEVKYNSISAFFKIQCPEEGSFIGYKKANNKIVKLLILEDSKRSSATSRKCRCDKAKVLSIESLDGKKTFIEVKSDYDSSFIYKVGEIVRVDNFCEDRWDECASGIHFFITKQEAIDY